MKRSRFTQPRPIEVKYPETAKRVASLLAQAEKLGVQFPSARLGIAMGVSQATVFRFLNGQSDIRLETLAKGEQWIARQNREAALVEAGI
jgi:hypothetical protein